MESRDFGAVVQDVQTLLSAGTFTGLTDDQLLSRFLGRRDDAAEAAFEALLRRHGPMVLRVCRGELHDMHAAEDAFQATFLVLVRKAASIRRRGSVASWLFGVARRVALRAKVERARREAYERRIALMAESRALESSPSQPVIVPEIQEEVDRLPEKYRGPIVLCYLEGLTHEEAAAQLRLPVGTVKIRLSRARERLRGRLVRRGLAPIALATTVGGKASGSMPASLVASTVKVAMQFAAGPAPGASASVAALVHGVQRAMLIAKIKTIAAVVATSLTAILASLLVTSSVPGAARSDQEAAVSQRPVAPPTRQAGASPPAQAAQEAAVETVKKSAFTRTTSQPGIVNAFDSANLHAKFAGYLEYLAVDIGSPVKKGQPLARIHAPELSADVERSQAVVMRAKARVRQSASAVKVAEATLNAERAKIEAANAEQRRSEATLRYRQKQRDRLQKLVEDKTVDQRILDEEVQQVEAAMSAAVVSAVQIDLAKAGLDEAKAKVEAAQADVVEAEASLLVAQADLQKSQILKQYAVVVAPYDGIVTRRTYHVGDFVRSGEGGGGEPLLTIVKTGKVRFVVLVPDRDAPFLDTGDHATVTIDALGGREYQGVIARTAFAEDPADRTVRAELDLANADGGLRPGQSGRVTIRLYDRGDVLTIPSSALIGRGPGREAACYRVVDGRAVRTKIEIGEHGLGRLEVVEGLKEGDSVIAAPGDLLISPGQTISSKKAAQPVKQ